MHVHECAYRNVQECVFQASGSPTGPHLLRPDQTMRRGEAWCGVVQSTSVCRGAASNLGHGLGLQLNEKSKSTAAGP